MRVLLRHLAPRHPPCTLCSLSHDVEKLKFPRISHSRQTLRPGSFATLRRRTFCSVYASAYSEPQLLFRSIQLLTCRPNSDEIRDLRIRDSSVACSATLASPLSSLCLSIRGWRLSINPRLGWLISTLHSLISLHHRDSRPKINL